MHKALPLKFRVWLAGSPLMGTPARVLGSTPWDTDPSLRGLAVVPLDKACVRMVWRMVPVPLGTLSQEAQRWGPGPDPGSQALLEGLWGPPLFDGAS